MGFPGLFCHNGVGDHLATPPPAHCGIPPYQIDPKMGKLKRLFVRILYSVVITCIDPCQSDSRSDENASAANCYIFDVNE